MPTTGIREWHLRVALVLKAGVRWKLHGVDEGGLKEVEELIEGF